MSAIEVGTRVRIKNVIDPWLISTAGWTGVVVAPEDEGWDFDWKVRFDFDPDGDLTSFYASELEVIP